MLKKEEDKGPEGGEEARGSPGIADLRTDHDYGIRFRRSSAEIGEIVRFRLAPGLPRPDQPYVARRAGVPPDRAGGGPARGNLATP